MKKFIFSFVFFFLIGYLTVIFPQDNPLCNLYPKLEYINVYGVGDYEAVWGYDNQSGAIQQVPVGADNKFIPSPINRGQPTKFYQGRHYNVFKTALCSDGSCLTWHLFNNEETACGKKILLYKSDGVHVMPKILGTPTTYTITYKNLSGYQATNVSIIDTMPYGTAYVSHSGNATVYGNVIIWQLGTLNSGTIGSVTLSVVVTDTNVTSFKNKAYMLSKIGCTLYRSYAEDVNCKPSGGYEAGIESSYDMAWALYQRYFTIHKGLATKYVQKDNPLYGYPLQTLIPTIGPENSIAFESTPFDIMKISNATSAYAVDYMLGEYRLGAVFSTTTNPPQVYNHTKPICDRLANFSLDELNVVFVNEAPYYLARLTNNKRNNSDATISFSVYEKQNEFIVDSKWTLDEYLVPGDAIQVYNFQVWSPSMNYTKQIVSSIIDKFKAIKNVSYTSNYLNDADVYFYSANYSNTGEVKIVTNNLTQNTENIEVEFFITRQQGMPEEKIVKNINAEPGIKEHKLKLGIMSSARVIMNSPNDFKDVVFLGGGVYGPFVGEKSYLREFSNIISSSVPNLPEGSYIFPGGARIKADLGDYVLIGRSLDGAYDGVDISKFDKLRFILYAKGKVRVFLEAFANGKYYYPYVVVDVNGEKDFEIPLRSFKIDNQPVNLTSVSQIGFEFNKAENPDYNYVDYSVKDLAIYNNNQVAVGSPGKSFELYQNYPNPFNPVTIIRFDLPKQTFVKLKVYDVLGREVATILDKEMPPVNGYEVVFDASKLSSGIYYYKLITSDITISKRMVIIK